MLGAQDIISAEDAAAIAEGLDRIAEEYAAELVEIRHSKTSTCMSSSASAN